MCVWWWYQVLQCTVCGNRDWMRTRPLLSRHMHVWVPTTFMYIWLCRVWRCLRIVRLNVYSNTICLSGSQIHYIASTELWVALKAVPVQTETAIYIDINWLVRLTLRQVLPLMFRIPIGQDTTTKSFKFCVHSFHSPSLKCSLNQCTLTPNTMRMSTWL